ncbi:flagellar hook-length control protein FliK [Paenibacillus sp. NPDC058071]|uniref:flagellar hook-length control protein FliK n=1 Tax=Paenibacillus sp. NPDC058071 TaxID=3346326 RepID=UPI0036D9581E
MEMGISGATTSQTTTSAASSTTGGGQTKANAGQFQQTLSGQMNGSASAQTDKAGSASATILSSIAPTAVGTTLGSAEATDLLAIIDHLIAELTAVQEQAPNQDEQDAAAEELQAMLEQLQALLALLGAPAMNPSNTAAGQGEQDPENGGGKLESVKQHLQTSLFQLQELLQDGTMKRVQQQEPTQLVLKQLQTLGEALQTRKEAGAEAKLTQAVETTAAPTASQSAWLQRLSDKAGHPSVLLAAVESTETELTGRLTALTGEESQTVQQPAVILADTARHSSIHQAAKALLQPYVQVDAFADKMTSFVQKLNFSILGDGLSEAKLQLFPEQLGQVDVRISVQNGILTAVFRADSASAKDMLDNQMAQLRASLQAQGLSVDKLEVTHSETASQLSNGYLGQGDSRQSFSNREQSKGDWVGDDGSFEEDVTEQIAIQDLGFGRAVNATA